MNESRLIFTNESPVEVTRALADSGTLVIADGFNAPRLGVADVVCVADQIREQIEEIKSRRHYAKVLAIGGCTALDFARACATGRPLIVVPTILSNSCLSTDRSVVRHGEIYRSEKTTAPDQTLISMPSIIESHCESTNKWSGSGLGDLLAGISAAIEFEWRARGKTFEGMTVESVSRHIPLIHDAFEWSKSLTGQLPRKDLVVLAYYLHESSLDVVRNGHTTLNAGAEHSLYYRMQQRHCYPKSITTHGRMVTIGTLLTTALFAEQTGNSMLHEELRSIYRQVSLPTTYAQLTSIGIERGHITAALEELSQTDCLYAHFPAATLLALVDANYGS
jgi:glycerol dehydrogenase-like iron-containing ADH family enzyme